MTPAQFSEYIRVQSGTDTTTLPDSTLLLYANIVKDSIAKELYKVNEDLFGTEWVKDLVAGQRYYSKPDDLLGHFKKIAVQFDPAKEPVVLHEYDMNVELRDVAMTETSIMAKMKGKKPAFDIFGDQILILSEDAIPTLTGGMAIYGACYPADLTDLTLTDDMSIPPSDTEYGMPRELHEVWATGVIIRYKTAQPKPLALNEKEQKFDMDLQSAINSLKGQNLDRELVTNLPYNDGSNY